jgi:hypothetical protein
MYSFKKLFSFMKFITIAILLSFLPNVLSAQCSGCTINVNASTSATFNLNSGDVLCFNAGTFTGTVGLNANGASICVASGATFGASANFNFNGRSVTINNYGSWHRGISLSDNSAFNNFGTYGSASTPIMLSLGNNSVFNNNSGASAHINNLNLNNNSQFNSAGSTTVTNGFSVGTGASLNILAGGNFTQTSTGDVNNNTGGSINVAAGGSFATAGNLNNNGNVNISGSMSVGGNLTNNGGGNINLNNTMINVGGNLMNNGSITASGTCGGIVYAGTSTQNSSGTTTATGGATVDICGSGNPYNSNSGSISNLINPKCSCVPPLSVFRFSAFALKDKSWNQIDIWQSSANNLLLEKSFNGIDFSVLQKIDIAPSTIFDKNPHKTTYYRLRDGNFISQILVVYQAFESFSMIVENPVQEQKIRVQFVGNAPTQAHLSLHLLDMHGKIIAHWQITDNFPQKLELEATYLPKGVYLLKANLNQEPLTTTRVVLN